MMLKGISEGYVQNKLKMHMLTVINSVINQVFQGCYSYSHIYWAELDMFIIKFYKNMFG